MNAVAGAQTPWLGQFTSRIHRTSGAVRLVTLLDGRRILRFENLQTTPRSRPRSVLTRVNGAAG